MEWNSNAVVRNDTNAFIMTKIINLIRIVSGNVGTKNQRHFLRALYIFRQ